MAFNNSQRGPNVIGRLNTILPAAEAAKEPPESFNYEAELAMFTNTEFFDFDVGHSTDFQHPAFPFNATSGADQKPLEYLAGDFAFADYPSFPQADGFAADSLPAMPLQGQSSHPPSTDPASIDDSPKAGLVTPPNGEKRKAHDPPYSSTFEDASRIAAEEDKRRRNTAASARFRVKKKQREQALEKSAKEMSDKVAALEGRINQLETENKWLKNLIMEKNENKDDISALWKKYNQEPSETRPSGHKDGVRTAEA